MKFGGWQSGLPHLTIWRLWRWSLAAAERARALRVFVEKDAAERKRVWAKRAEIRWRERDRRLPKGVPVELLSGVTHEDCAAFATDFGTLLDVEDVVPGSGVHAGGFFAGTGTEADSRAEEFARFQGSLVKVKTFTPVNESRMWTGRLTGFADGVLKIDLAAVKQKGKAKKAAVAEMIEIPLSNVEKANLVVEI
jgi:ribosome maturation factor RimP